MKETEKIYQSLIEVYNKGIQAKDPKMIRDFLNDNSVDQLCDEPRYYLEILQLRAASFSLFGELTEAGEEYRKGYSSCSNNGKWVYGLNWALQFMAEFSFNRGNERVVEVMDQGILVLNQALLDLPDDEYREYYHLTLTNLRAFMMLCSGKKEDAIQSFKDCKFIPVPIPTYNDKESLQLLFAHYTKGLAVAIELKDVQLLMNLLKVISIDDALLNGEENLFKKFYETLVSTFDMRTEFITEFNAMFKIKNSLQSITPNFSKFLDLIGDQNFDKLNNFFQEFYQ